MKETIVASAKDEVIFAGVGGMGALTAGQLLAQAAFSCYSHVTWYPNITTARRNAPADCIVIFSPQPIPSPLIYQVGTVVALESAQAKAFEERVRPGGLMLVETAGLKEYPERGDIRVLKIDGVGTALSLGSIRAANLVFLGAYIGATGAIAPALIEKELEKRFNARQEILDFNRQAFQAGVKLVENHEWALSSSASA